MAHKGSVRQCCLVTGRHYIDRQNSRVYEISQCNLTGGRFKEKRIDTKKL